MYDYNTSTTATKTGTCNPASTGSSILDITGDQIQDTVCLGATTDEYFCAGQLEFCTVTGGNDGWYFNYGNGFVGFAPTSSEDEKARSFIENDSNISRKRVSWNFNIAPTQSTVMFGGYDSAN